ncbi:MAG: DNA recombination protein RmuC [Gammaproteobacteria bacterium]|nr:DNA recombination protein RmuC [Gammaproteobacteria bacterium]
MFFEHHEKFLTFFNEHQLQQQARLMDFKETIQKAFYAHREKFDEHQLSSLKLLQESLQTALEQHSQHLTQRVDTLTDKTDNRLKEISGQVEKRLSEGFEKTTATFTDVIKRLALIDEAQKKITELSSNVVSLQEVLADKRSRGAFGEIQLSALIRNVLPESHFAFQHTLSNSKRVDCILFLPQPTGNVVIDAKFPLDSYRNMTDLSNSTEGIKTARQQFRQDIKKHIYDIASKYIIAGETSEFAVMFIPSEAVFAEIHSHFYDLVEAAHQARVSMVSPSTMMAIITTVRAVIKDVETQKQVHIIREHLGKLAKDFERFQIRMNNLATHIGQAHDDVKEVHISAKKITSRFNQIERVEIEQK